MHSTTRRAPAAGSRPAPSSRRAGSAARAAELARRIQSREAIVGVVGQGYVGFPLAQRIAACGFHVFGYDRDRVAVARCAQHNEQPLYRATDSLLDLRCCDVLLVAVPTPTSDGAAGREPDLSVVLGAIRALAEDVLIDGWPRLLVVESSYGPGTTRRTLAPLVAEYCRLGETLWLGYSPERIDPGNSVHTLATTPKVTSGFDRAAAELTRRFYAQIVERVVTASSLEAAELTKMLENASRLVGIALMQEIDELCEQLRVSAHEVVNLAATKPFGYLPFYAGAGIGGHCIAEDPYFLERAMRDAGVEPAILRAALANHEARASVIVRRIAARLPDGELCGRRILLLGVAYKPNASDARRSPALPILRLLEARGAMVDYHDPFVPRFAERASIAAAAAVDYDLAVIITAHAAIDLAALAGAGCALYDTRGMLRQRRAPAGSPLTPRASGSTVPGVRAGADGG